MAKGYWLALVDVSDPESYKPYVAGIQDVFRKFGGRYVIRGGRNEVMARHHGRVRRLRHRARRLQVARIRRGQEAAPALRHRRSRGRRRL
jgi:uncharacterized protein (DUF1330 family)